ncbi:hypothetical protein AB2L28_14800 [Kineococcus sp. TBRC 1896]|uniref:Uncharacterized protein n=1 Tax=Kineococcus mangrovi TaxID=1660183 RepID=A0ABV4I484_9ACTN
MSGAASAPPTEPGRSASAAHLRTQARAHWVNAIVLLPCTRPFLRLDGAQEHPLAWGRTASFPLAAGTHLVETFVRYRGTPWPTGTGRLHLDVGGGEDVDVLARNGPLNHQPLQPRLASRRPPVPPS